MKFIVTLLVTLSMPAFAASYTVTCDPPVAREDGSSLSPGEIQEYEFYVDGTLDGTSPSCSHTVTRPDGSFVITAITVDTGGRKSALSGPFTLVLTTPNPNPPTNIR